MSDPKARQILIDAYWTSAGWRDKPHICKADLELAIAAGVMFEPRILSHKEIVEWVLIAVPKVSKTEISNAFLSSLNSRRLELRSALGSYATMRHFPRHRASGAVCRGNFCDVCEEFIRRRGKEDLNVLNFERFKWGGVRHLSPLYAAFDLEQFLKCETTQYSTEDVDILRQIIQTATRMNATATPNDLARELKNVFASNQDERRVVIEILGYCGILQPRQHAGFFHSFVPFAERDDPPHSKNDWNYPVSLWRGSDGVNQEALNFYFPEIQQ